MKYLQRLIFPCFQIFFLLALLLALQNKVPAQAQETSPIKDSSKVYVIGALQDFTKSRTITLQGEMTFVGTKFFGQYHYDGNIGVLRLEGIIKPDNSVRIEEKSSTGEFNEKPNAKETIYAIISGTLNRAQGIITGTWTSADGKNSYPCTLSAIANFIEKKENIYVLSVKYPAFANSKYASLNQSIQKNMMESLVKNKKQLEEIQSEILKSTPKGEKPDIPYDLTKTDEMSIYHLSERFLSAYHIESSFTGGAHFNYYYFGETWWNEGGKAWRKVAMKELFTADTAYIQRLNTLIVAKLKQQGAQFVVDGTFTDFTDLLRKGKLTWVMRPAGITFIFAPLSVATFADGEFAAFISWKAMKEFVRKDGPAGEFIK
jgi:hypothetical protein